MDGQHEKEPCSSATSASSTRPKRLPKRQQKTQISTDERDASNLAPTAVVLLNKEKQELNLLKEKLEWQKKKIEELEEERDFLRGQLSALTAMQESMDNKVTVNDSETSNTSSMSSSSSSSSSSSTPKKRKSKKKHSKAAKKHKREHKTFRQRVQTPSEIVCRYRSILKTLPKTKTMTKALQKHGIDRNTVVCTSAIGELAIAAPEVYEETL
uniref:Coiled-coil domain-containing protein 106-like n=1 Tax=Astyanax mexicanus TaxID=7994 RepID=A0A3B1J8A2_ASTMX